MTVVLRKSSNYDESMAEFDKNRQMMKDNQADDLTDVATQDNTSPESQDDQTPQIKKAADSEASLITKDDQTD